MEITSVKIDQAPSVDLFNYAFLIYTKYNFMVYERRV